MKGRVLVLGEWRGRELAALLIDGQLDDLRIAPPETAPPAPETILRAIADRPVKGQGGMFVKLPGGASGFLRETAGIAPGRPVIVQVAGYAEPGKAVPVTTRWLIKGRLAILTPGAPGVNLSRRLGNANAREHLEQLAARAMKGADESLGLILRTAAMAAEDTEIAAEIAALRALAQGVAADAAGPPALLRAAPGPHETARRDWADPPPDDIAEGAAVVAAHGVAAALDALLDPEQPLQWGGHMVIEPTRALIAVDVNTGSDTSPAAGLKANLAAARELPRALRLRGLGGQVIVDFAPMPKKDRVAIEQKLRAAFKSAGDEAHLAGWTPLGNYELQRRRDRLPLARLLGPDP